MTYSAVSTEYWRDSLRRHSPRYAYASRGKNSKRQTVVSVELQTKPAARHRK